MLINRIFHRKQKLISVIIPAYNAERYIKEAIDSALAQTYKNIEIIVVDDGSTDNTRSIVASYKSPKIRLITHEDNENHGICKSRYLGFANSRGEYITFLDSDDVFLPEKIEKQVGFLEESPAVLTHCKAVLQNETSLPYNWNFSKGMKIKQYNLIKDTDYLSRNDICPSATLIRAEALKSIYFDIEKFNGPADWYTWVCLSIQTKKDFLYTPEPLLKYRMHEESWTFRAFQSEAIQLQCKLDVLSKLKAHIKDPAVLRDIEKALSDTKETTMRCPTLKELPPPPSGKTGWPWTEESKQLPDKMPDGKPWPKISIVTPSYDQGCFLEETIRSVLLQGYPELEYIIIDGGSTDNSTEIIKKYEKWLGFWASQKDKGQSNAINKGLKRSGGEMLGWINSDDLLMPNALSVVGKILGREGKASWMIGSSELIDESGTRIRIRKPGVVNMKCFIDWADGDTWFAQQSTFFTKPMLDRAGLLDEDLHLAMDLDLWIRMYRIAPPIVINAMLSKYRFHARAKCPMNKIDAIRPEISRVLRKNKVEADYREVLLVLIQLARFMKMVRTAIQIVKFTALGISRKVARSWSSLFAK